MCTVLLAEDDTTARTTLARTLSAQGYVVRAVDTAAEALRESASHRVDIVILDLGLPDIDGSHALRMIRGISDVPIIIATSRHDERSVVSLLNGGADDYVVKPLSSEVLIARMRALLRRTRTEAPPSPVFHIGDLHIDILSRTVTFRGRALDLTRKEFDLLSYLAVHRDRVVSRRALVKNVWKNSDGVSNQSIDVHVSWLRRKLGENAASPRYLHTVRGVGLKLTSPP